MASSHPLMDLDSPITEVLANGGVLTGFFTVTIGPEIAEIMAVSGADFVVLDMEAAPSGKRDVLECLLALNGPNARESSGCHGWNVT